MTFDQWWKSQGATESRSSVRQIADWAWHGGYKAGQQAEREKWLNFFRPIIDDVNQLVDNINTFPPKHEAKNDVAQHNNREE